MLAVLKFVLLNSELSSFENREWRADPYQLNNISQLVIKDVHDVLVNCLFKLAQEKVWLGELTVLP